MDPDSLVSDAKLPKDVKEFSKLVQNGTWTANVNASALLQKDRSDSGKPQGSFH